MALISVSMLTTIAVMSVRSLVIPVIATKNHCNRSEGTCDIKTAEDVTTTQENESNNDSNIIDEDSDLEGYQTEANNSTSAINSLDSDQFSPIGV
jgi:hypothetical protein